METEDETVTAFAEYNGKFYAGTSPAGIVYSFDGAIWKEEHRPYGNGVTSMVGTADGLFVFSLMAEGPVVYNGNKWMTVPVKNAQQVQTVASHRAVLGGIHGSSGAIAIDPVEMNVEGIGLISGEDIKAVGPVSPQFNIATAIQSSSGVMFGGLDNGIVTAMQGGTLVKAFDVGTEVIALTNIADGIVMAASKDTIFLAKEGV